MYCKIHVRGMWSLGGKQCKCSAVPETTWDEIKELVQRDTGVQIEMQELQTMDGACCNEPSACLGQTLSSQLLDGDRHVSLLLFSKPHPDRVGLLRRMQDGQISAAEVAALDPDALMPAC